MKKSMLELYRAIIPENHIINDNHGQHYRIMMGNLNWLTEQFEWIKNGFYEKTVGRGRGVHKEIINYNTPGNFKIPDIQEVKNFINNNIISIRCEVWKPTNRRFDPQNYAKTFKAPIDLLVSNGYIIDDNWKYINGITYVGGGPEVWGDRAERFVNDNLPDSGSDFINWWKQYSENYNDILIRIIIINNN